MNAFFRDHPIPPLEFLLQGGDLFQDCGVHDIDFARYLVNSHDSHSNIEVKSVFAHGKTFNPDLKNSGVLDVCKAMIEFENDTLFHLGKKKTFAQFILSCSKMILMCKKTHF